VVFPISAQVTQVKSILEPTVKCKCQKSPLDTEKEHNSREVGLGQLNHMVSSVCCSDQRASDFPRLAASGSKCFWSALKLQQRRREMATHSLEPRWTRGTGCSWEGEESEQQSSGFRFCSEDEEGAASQWAVVLVRTTGWQ
jgi:hypothetical protein